MWRLWCIIDSGIHYNPTTRNSDGETGTRCLRNSFVSSADTCWHLLTSHPADFCCRVLPCWHLRCLITTRCLWQTAPWQNVPRALRTLDIRVTTFVIINTWQVTVTWTWEHYYNYIYYAGNPHEKMNLPKITQAIWFGPGSGTQKHVWTY